MQSVHSQAEYTMFAFHYVATTRGSFFYMARIQDRALAVEILSAGQFSQTMCFLCSKVFAI